MTETTKNSGDKLSVSSTKTLTLKRGGVEQGVVRQSFSHGRSKAVVVEKVKRRIGPAEGKAEPVAPERSATPKQAAAPATRKSAGSDTSGRSCRFAENLRRRAAHAHRGRAQRPRSSARRRAIARTRRALARRARGPRSPHPRGSRSRRARGCGSPQAQRRRAAASTTRKPSARPTKSPRNASAPMRPRQQSPVRRPALEADDDEAPAPPPWRRGSRVRRRRRSRRAASAKSAAAASPS